MTKVLIGLFSNTWNQIWHSFEMDNLVTSYSLNNVGSVLCKRWENEKQYNSEFEFAVFQDTLSDPTDLYPSTYRRFKQIGNRINEKIRNMFELGFEKGYEKVVFVDPILAFHSTNIIKEIQNNWKPGSLLFLPDSNGKIALCGMDEDHFWQFENFEFQENEAIVEVLSDCNSKNIPFTLLSSFDVKKAETLWKEAYQASLGNIH